MTKNLTENHSPTEVLYYSFIDWYYFIHLKKNKEKILNGPTIGAPQDVLQKPLPGLFLEILQVLYHFRSLHENSCETADVKPSNPTEVVHIQVIRMLLLSVYNLEAQHCCLYACSTIFVCSLQLMLSKFPSFAGLFFLPIMHCIYSSA